MRPLAFPRFGFRIVIFHGLLCIAAFSQTSNFGPIDVPGTSVIFDPDNVLTPDQLTALLTAGPLSPTPAVAALRFTAAFGQTFTFAASGLVGCCSVADIGPDGYPDDPENITSLGSISGFNSPNGLPLVGVFTNGTPDGSAPPDYDYSAGLDQAHFAPKLNQVFFIGDGLTGAGSGVQQVFSVPAAATELWLGFVDGGTFQGPPANYGDNLGYLVVEGTLHGCLSTPAGSISSRTLARVPKIDDESRTCLGVGEQVLLSADRAATWSVSSISTLSGLSVGQSLVSDDPRFLDGYKNFPPRRDLPHTECDQSGLSVSQSHTNSVCLSVPYQNDLITVTATFDDGTTASKSFTVTQPTGLILQRLEFPENKPKSDYNFALGQKDDFTYSPAVFVLPGNVSFAYAGIAERDGRHPPGEYSPPFNLLFDLNGTKAWLETCDTVRRQESADGNVSYPLIFSPFNANVEPQFASVQTGWAFYPDHFTSWKGQTPITPETAAELNVPYRELFPIPIIDRWVEPSPASRCQEQVTK